MRFVSLALVLSGVTASAHHSVDRTYDLKREVELKGMLRQVLLRNPHSFLQIEVLDQDGKTRTWALEFPKGRGTLLKQGIQPGTLKAGDQVTITLNPPRMSADNRGYLVALHRESDGFEWRSKTKRHQS